MQPGAQQFLDELGLTAVSGGMPQAIRSLGHLAAWSARRAPDSATTSAIVPPIAPGGDTVGAWSEQRARELLARHGVPVIPAALATTADEAAAAANGLGYPVALKVVSADILHKSEIGGVRLDLRDEALVRDAFAAVNAAARIHAPGATIEGVLISPMRAGGVELLVGVVRDPTFGQVLAVGLGGIYVEVFKDASLRVLPVGQDEIRAILDELHGAPLLLGARGARPADLDALVAVIARVAAVAQGLGDTLESLEINPLRVEGDQIEALDAVVTWRADT